MNDKGFIRWQARRIEQLSSAHGLFVTLALGCLAYSVTLLRDAQFTPPRLASWTFLLSLVSTLVSLTFSVGVVISRLLDFRLTAQVTRGKASNPDDLRAKAEAHGNATWRLYWGQVFSFGLGAATLALSLWLTYGLRFIL